MRRSWIKITMALVLGTCLPLSICRAGDQPKPADQRARESYSLGYEFGENLKKQEIQVDKDILYSAISEALDDKKPALDTREIHETLLQLRRKVMVMQDRRIRERAARNLEQGRAFLAANRTKEGIRTLADGLQYKELREGDGPVPKATDIVTLHYRGALADGTEFNSTYRRGEPDDVKIEGMIRGWKEALQLMKAGSKWRIFVPSELAYGDRQFGSIPPNSVLIFEIELLSIKDEFDYGISRPKTAIRAQADLSAANDEEPGHAGSSKAGD